jgi:hypothetical protein
LIAFSNRKYYENKLYTFPSPNDMVSQVRLIPVEGFYDMGKTRQNKKEAEAIVQEIIKRLSDPVQKNKSIGVVTFSSVQQNLIADMLEAEFSKYPDLDELNHNHDEPIFIKNLENVQGDERDVILFSICYGPAQNGNVGHNFGPLNREGGWRRLNVAVSRARYEMLIFSTLRPEQIDLNRTRADGVAGLKSFLEFADRGIQNLPVPVGKKQTSIGVISNVADAVRNLGYTVNTNIGCSGYQVDIGIIHPEKSDKYVIGILCDGMNYYNGGTASDRNDTQESVLRGLGWKIIRVWVLDWWDNPGNELQRIRSCIDEALEAADGTDEVDIEPERAKITQVESFEKLSNCATEDVLDEYFPARLPIVVGFFGNYEYFASYESTRIIMGQIEAVLNIESPVNRDVMCKRVLEAWGISRMGSRIKRRFDQLFSVMQLRYTSAGKSIFYWKIGVDNQLYDSFRLPTSDERTRRNLEHIAPEEIASAIRYILTQQIGMLTEDLEREVSRIFGFARCTEAMQGHIRAGLRVAIERNWAVVDGNRVTAV